MRYPGPDWPTEGAGQFPVSWGSLSGLPVKKPPKKQAKNSVADWPANDGEAVRQRNVHIFKWNPQKKGGQRVNKTRRDFTDLLR